MYWIWIVTVDAMVKHDWKSLTWPENIWAPSKHIKKRQSLCCKRRNHFCNTIFIDNVLIDSLFIYRKPDDYLCHCFICVGRVAFSSFEKFYDNRVSTADSWIGCIFVTQQLPARYLSRINVRRVLMALRTSKSI